MTLALPPDIANLLAVSIRDVIWFKDSVYSYLKNCGVTKSVLEEVRRIKGDTPTIKIVLRVLDRLDEMGEDGDKAAKSMLTTMFYWNDLHSVSSERRDSAIASLKALREAYKRYEAQLKYRQEQQEKQMHAERANRGRTSELDHKKLQSFRDEFDGVHSTSDPILRGNRFQDLMNRIFRYYCEESKGDFNRTGEQIDGLFYFEKHWWYVEIRWRKEKANAADISVLRDRARDAFGGDTKALFMSFNGFTNDCMTGISGKSDERVILMDGFDLRCVLDCQIAFEILLAEKQADIVQNKRVFVGASEIINRRAAN
jgi:hypothetical protein